MKIAFIGLGRMGGPICRNLLAGGHELWAYDLAADAVAACVAAGAKTANSVAEVVRPAELIVTSLPGPKEVRGVVLGEAGIAQHGARGAVYADLSTNAPSTVRELGQKLSSRGIDMLDAPVSGGIRGAEQGSLAMMVGGEQQTFERCLPVLRCTAESISHVGALGCGSIAKLVNNMLVFNMVAASAEALMLGVAAGMAADDLNTVIRHSSGNSLIYRAVARKVLSGDWSANFALDLACKDEQLALDLAKELGVEVPVGQESAQLLKAAQAQGYGEQDMAAVMRVLEAKQGLEVRATSEKS